MEDSVGICRVQCLNGISSGKEVGMIGKYHGNWVFIGCSNVAPQCLEQFRSNRKVKLEWNLGLHRSIYANPRKAPTSRE